MHQNTNKNEPNKQQETQQIKPTTSEYIHVTKSKIHNAGVFAEKDIPKGTKIIEYVGELLTKEESEKRADVHLEAHSTNKEEKGAVYIFTLNDEYDIDGDVPYNTAKYINHSCNPNCETDVIDDHIWVLSSRDIKKGEELTYNYGYDLDMYEDHPCKCGSENCIGYIVAEEHWPEVIKQKEEKLKESNEHKH